MNGEQEKKRNHRKYSVYSFLIPFMLTLIMIVGLYFFLIFIEPQSMLNPFPPAPQKEAVAPEQVSFVLTQTATFKIENTTTPTQTPSPSLTPTEVKPEATSTATRKISPTTSPTADSAVIVFNPVASGTHPVQLFYTPTPTPQTGYIYPFVLVKEPRFKASPYNDFVPNPIINCNWIGVGGQVFDILGEPLPGIQVRLGGIINEEEIEYEYTLSGDALIFGLSGYEFKLGNKTFYNPASIFIQLIDKDGLPLSAKAHFSTTDHCTQNWIEIDFIQVR